MTNPTIGYRRDTYHKTTLMKKILILTALLFPSLLFGQAGEFFLRMPFKYETPSPEMDLSISDQATEKVWHVMTAKNDVPVYSDERCQTIKSTEPFLRFFTVWKETIDAILVVTQIGDGPLINDYKFTANAAEVGWIKKRDLILWERCLSINRIMIRAILKKAPDNKNLPVNMPGFKGKIDTSGFGVYYVLKTEPDAWLLCETDLLNEGLQNDAVFWVEKSSLFPVYDNKAYVPDWLKVEQGEKLYSFSDPSKTDVSDTLRASMKIKKNNPFLGYLIIKNEKNTNKVLNPLITAPDTQYIKANDARFLKANLLDNIQFTSLKEVARIVSTSFSKKTLRTELLQYFSQHNIDTTDDKLSTMSVADMLGYTLGIDFSGYSAGKTTLVDSIKDIDLESYNKAFAVNYERLLSEKELSKYRFISGMAYYWLPQNFLSLDILSKISLIKSKITIHELRPYKEFDVFYIDPSSSSGEKSFTQLQSEIKKLNINMDAVWKSEANSSDVGHLIFYSSGMDPIITSGEDGFQKVTTQMRNSTAIRPDKLFDKLRLENALMSQIETVTDKIILHFDVSDYFFRSEIEDRSYFFKEFVERINSILATRNTRILIYLYCYSNPANAATTSMLQTFCNSINSQNQNIKFELYKYK